MSYIKLNMKDNSEYKFLPLFYESSESIDSILEGGDSDKDKF